MKNKLRNLLIGAGAPVFVSVIVAMAVVRWCFSPEPAAYLSPKRLICGYNLKSGNNFRKLKGEEMFVTSNINESKEFSLDRGNDASKLVDESLITWAAPANNKIDYVINFISDTEIKTITIHWGDFGQNKNYISKWLLESVDGQSWKQIASGESPNGNQTVINKNFISKGLKLRAESEKDWIGVHELEIIGRPL